jgi:RNA polymerase sigma-70 factor (ECF subfamily)
MSDAGPESVTELVEMFYESLYRYAFRLSGSAADADDLTQETFCKAQAQFKQLRDRNRAKPWLFSIVRNLYLHKLRIAKQFVTLSLDSVAELPENVSDTLPEIDSEQLQQALGELPEVFRTPIILYYFEDFSYRDIADQMDLPIGTVMSRLARAKGFLRQKLIPELSSPPRGAHDRAGNDATVTGKAIHDG